MYSEYWKLTYKPFENVSDVRFVYYSEQHREALARLIYAVREKKSGAFITGPYGVGKTMVRDVLLDRIRELRDEEMFRFPVIIENPVCSTVGMLRLLRTRIAEEARKLSHDEAWLDICRVDPVESTTPALEFNLLNGLLCDISRQKRHVVLIIEQAHLVHNADTLEQLTMLMNLQYKGRRRLLTVLYFGHEGVVPFIRQHPSFMQRIPCCWHIHALSEEQTAEYIKHRIMVAGTDRQIFTAEALELIWKHSDGIPREINNICDFALFLGASAEVEFIDGNLVQQVCRDVDLFASGSAIV